MKKKPNKLRDEKGQILLIVAIVLALCMMSIPALLNMTSASQRTTQMRQDEMQRFYAADVGIEDALSKMNDITFTAPSSYDISDVNGRTVSVEINKQQEGTYEITSTATGNNEPETIVVTTVAMYDLTVSSSTGGNVTQPGESSYLYPAGTVVTLLAVSDAEHDFIDWTGDIATVSDPNNASTTITMNGDYAILANFATPLGGSADYWLTVNSSSGGSVTMPGEDTFPYSENAIVDLLAVPDSNYNFDNWTGDVGTVANVNDDSTTITMNGNYTITANFSPVQYTLTVTSSTNGSVTDPGEGSFDYNVGTVVDLLAVADYGYSFVNWTGDVGTVANPNADSTTITMNGDYTVHAAFTGSTCYPCFEYALASIGEDEELSVAKTTHVDFSADGDVYVRGNLILDRHTHIKGNTYATGNIELEPTSEISGNAHAEGYINLEKSSIIDGNAYAEGNIQVGRDAIIRGSAYSSANVEVHSSGQVLGDIEEFYPDLPPLPELTPPTSEETANLAAQYESEAELGGTYYGNYVVPNNAIQDLGPLHITGNLVISNNAVVTMTGTIYVDGTVEISNNASIIGPGIVCAEGTMYIQNNSASDALPLFMSLSNIVCKNNCVIDAALYAPNGQIVLENNASVYGSAVANSISTNNNFDITHAPELFGDDELPPCGCP